MRVKRLVAASVCAVSIGAAVGLGACGGGTPANQTAPPPSALPPVEDDPLPPSVIETALPESVQQAVFKPFTGDFNEMLERRVVRVGVNFNRSFYFVDKGVQRGIVYDYGQLMEQRINEKLGSGNIKVHVFFVPLPREQLLPALVDGKV